MRFAVAAAAALLCFSGQVIADDDSGPIAGLRGSFAFREDISGHDNATPQDKIKAHSGVGGGGSLFWGYRLPYGFQGELELLYRYQPLSSGSINGVSGSVGGYVQTFAPMFNVYWNVPTGDFPVTPFIGGGVGYAWNEAGVDRIDSTTFPMVHDDKWRFAYNAMAGIAIPWGKSARVTAMYRWLHEDIDVTCGGTISCSARGDASSVDFGLEFKI